MRRDQPHRSRDKPDIVIDSYYSFPGIILHELAHKWAAERRGLTVQDYKLWNWRNGGHVSHEPAKSAGDKIAVASMPLFINTAASVVLWAFAAAIFGVVETPLPRFAELILALLFAWVAWSAGKHAIPSHSDASGAWRAAWRRPSWSYRQAKLRSVAAVLVALSKIKFVNSVVGILIGIIVCFPIFVFYDISWQLVVGEYIRLIFTTLEMAEKAVQ